MKRASAAACVSVAIVAVTAAGCTTDASHRPGSTGPARQTAASEGRELTTASEGRELTDAEQLLIQRAEGLLVKKCMEAAGFAYWVERQPTADELKGGGYVLTDVDGAKRNGYGSRIDRNLQQFRHDDPNAAYANALPEKERVRYGKMLEGGPSVGMLTAELPGGGTVQTPRESLALLKERVAR